MRIRPGRVIAYLFLIFLGIAFGLAIVIVLASLIAAPQRPDPEKTSAYECGFEAFDDARSKFDGLGRQIRDTPDTKKVTVTVDLAEADRQIRNWRPVIVGNVRAGMAVV